ncbi:MAG: anti-sigma factor [Alphaproteobacteria bacterium]|nr:anti-sigma factor [Alphaproteobacteria bacterium]
MTTAPDNRDLEINALVDGELDASTQAEVEAWLATNPKSAEQASAYRQFNTDLHQIFDKVLDEPIPAALHPALINARRTALWWRRPMMAAAAVLLVLIGGLGMWAANAVLVPGPAASDTLVAEATRAYAVYVPELLHPVEVTASDPDHLNNWLSSRTGRTLVAPDLTGNGFRLLGGRLLPSADGPAAQFMYQDTGGRRVTLYLRPGDGAEPREFAAASGDGWNAFSWGYPQIACVIVGDLEPPELRALAESAYRQIGVSTGAKSANSWQ